MRFKEVLRNFLAGIPLSKYPLVASIGIAVPLKIIVHQWLMFGNGVSLEVRNWGKSLWIKDFDLECFELDIDIEELLIVSTDFDSLR